MSTFIIRRFLQLIPTVLGITLLVFVVVRVSGDPVAAYLGNEETAVAELTEVQVQAIRARLGLDQPLPVQYLVFLRNMLVGDLGESFIYQNQSAIDLVRQRLPATAQLAGAAFVFGVLISLPAGIVAAMYRNKLPDTLANLYAILGEAMPNFWVGIMLILLFSVALGWLPVSGRGGPAHLVLPAITLGTSMSALLMRLIRSSLLDVLRLDYVRTARAKGLNPRTVLFKHALRNAAISYVTVLGLSVTSLLSGSVVVESVFAWPGLGLLFITAIGGRDMAVIQAIVIFTALLVILGNLLVDIIYTVLDPRIQYT